MKAVEQLSLVLMDSFDMDVKDGLRVYLYFVLILQISCKLLLILLKITQNKNFKHEAKNSLFFNSSVFLHFEKDSCTL